VLSIDTPIPHQLRSPPDLHNFPLVPCSCCHSSLVHIPHQWQDRDRKNETVFFSKSDIGLTLLPAVPQPQHPNSTPLRSPPNLDRHPSRHYGRWRHSTPLDPSSSAAICHLLTPHTCTETARCVLPTQRICSAWYRAAYRTGGW
jgi:hypothetical protein